MLTLSQVFHFHVPVFLVRIDRLLLGCGRVSIAMAKNLEEHASSVLTPPSSLIEIDEVCRLRSMNMIRVGADFRSASRNTKLRKFSVKPTSPCTESTRVAG